MSTVYRSWIQTFLLDFGHSWFLLLSICQFFIRLDISSWKWTFPTSQIQTEHVKRFHVWLKLSQNDDVFEYPSTSTLVEKLCKENKWKEFCNFLITQELNRWWKFYMLTLLLVIEKRKRNEKIFPVSWLVRRDLFPFKVRSSRYGWNFLSRQNRDVNCKTSIPSIEYIFVDK